MKEKIILYCVIVIAVLLGAAAAMSQESPQALLERADALYKEKKHDAALALYQQAIAADGALSQAYRGVVLCYGALGNPQGALKYLDAQFLEKPDTAELEYGMGCALYNLQKYGDAAKYFDKAIKMKPDLAAAWNNRGSIYHFVDSDYAKARQHYEKAIEIGTRTGNAAVVKIAQENLANLPRAEDLKAMGLEEFLNAFIARADDSDVAGLRWLVTGQKANCAPALDWLLDQALQAGAQAAADEEKTAVALATLLAAQYSGVYKSDNLKQKLAAYQGLTPAQKKKTVEGAGLLARGSEKEQQGAAAQAAEDYGRALACFQAARDKARAALAQLYLGDAQRAQKKYAEARASYSDAAAALAALKDERQQAQALSSLGITCALGKDYAAAQDSLKRALKIYTTLKDEQSAKKVRENLARVEQMTK